MNVKPGVHKMNTAIPLKQFVIRGWPFTSRQRHARVLTPMSAARLLYLVTEDWYFLSHRLPMARAAQQAGFEVHVATRVGDHAAAIAAEGFALHPLHWQRGSANPLAVLRSAAAIRSLYRAVRPDLVHHVGLQPSVVGSLAALGLPIVAVNAVAGMGFAFTGTTPKARLVRLPMTAMIRLLFNRPASTVLVQNPDDEAAMERLGIAATKIARIPGSGVDIDRLTPLPEPGGPTTAAYVGRLLEDKGLPALIEAHALLVGRGKPLRLWIAGEPDPANPASMSPAVLAQWRTRPGVEFLGHVADIRTVWAEAHIAVLPSRREGLPLSLLEAAACARPLVATDVPGCREIVRPGVNGLLVPVDDAAALAEAMIRLAGDPALRARYGAAGRRLVETEFSSARIGREIVALYRRLLEDQSLVDARSRPRKVPSA
jgi:glycosyltransferase involved in cell wall biosynthesis